MAALPVRLKAPWALSIVIACLMTVQAAAGLLLDIYRDPEWIRTAWLGNDIVTLFLVVPALTACLALVRRGSMRAEMLWYGLLAYCVYNYGYYLFGANLNAVFPLCAALFVLGVVALAMALGTVDASAIAARFSPRTPVRTVGGYLVFTGVGLGSAWLALWAGFVFAGGELPVEPDAFQVVASMDLSFVVPFCVLGGVLLWRKHRWGYVLAPIVAVKGATYTLVLSVSSVIGAVRGLEGMAGQSAVWVVWTLVGAAAAAALFRAIQPLPVPAETASSVSPVGAEARA